jgi:hypothetical protein
VRSQALEMMSETVGAVLLAPGWLKDGQKRGCCQIFPVGSVLSTRWACAWQGPGRGPRESGIILHASAARVAVGSTHLALGRTLGLFFSRPE